MKTLLALTISMIFVPPALCQGSSIDISSSNWFAKTSNTGDAGNWFFTSASALASTMNWSGGPDNINATIFAATSATERKFTGVAVPVARPIFTGFSRVDVSPALQQIALTGAGSSSGPNVFGFYSADWSLRINSSGLVAGTDTWNAKEAAGDPWNIYPTDLAGLGSTYSLFIPLAINSASATPGGSGVTSGYEIDVTYSTMAGTQTLLDISVTGTHAVVTPSPDYSLSQLQLFLESSAQVAPSGSGAPPGTAISFTDLQTDLNSDIDGSGNLIAPIYLGVVLNGIAVPTQLFSDGSVANTGVSSMLFDASPEPSTFALAALGFVGLAAVGWRRRPRPA